MTTSTTTGPGVETYPSGEDRILLTDGNGSWLTYAAEAACDVEVWR